MAIVDLVMPKMGESIMEATILKWLKKEGDSVELDESILEIATDKVDSDIPSPVEGVISEILFSENEVVEVGKVIAKIKTESDAEAVPSPAVPDVPEQQISDVEESSPNGHASDQQREFKQDAERVHQPKKVTAVEKASYNPSSTDRFYSPLVRTIAQQEAISVSELDQIEGSGANGRVTKSDILNYVDHKKSGKVSPPVIEKSPVETSQFEKAQVETSSAPSQGKTSESLPQAGTEIIEMDRMRKLIAEHMVHSKHTSPHVTSFVEVDVTDIVEWRERVKVDFQKKYGEKITYTPIFIEAVTMALKDYPMVNVSLEGDKIIKKNFVNIGMAAALPTGNLIVPVIKDADHMNLLGLTKSVNDLAKRARENKLKADEIQGGTFTVTNVGTFGNVMGTPIINQPQVAILAVGAIRKKPAVVETEAGDLIAVRQMMFLSLSYDHRVVDGFLGGSFLRKIADYLEAFDKTRNI
ncbi:dihydrolipoamide acetyltransferase family protein [Portibacter marinus]|uniref:dihydrolipoamide acetyltransferase family protein n=1 Tax=Portibacter marinus TaxID=2898660 RepID=UPI001F26E7EF|nr:dihydrolipoamide acetyltransferase family protein [Portibacter marinus]